ncbi:MAG: DUF4827 family protein [Bacteroidales bacterium]|nr:DUF4827 family protein [Candidatus Scybalocola fimicaballi]
MKSKNIIIFLLASLSLMSCRDDNYADHVDAENEAIDKYFKDINAVIVREKPAQMSGEWLDSNNRKIFYRTSSGLYYHQVALGDTTATKPKISSTVYIRYAVTDLKGQMIYNVMESNSPNPVKLLLTGSSNDIYGAGFQESVMYLNKGGKCEAVVSFKINNTYPTSQEGGYSSKDLEYLPMLYDIRLVNVE